ncbi:hypothetical protein T03_17404 [Trichinella britovi]|uniref:Uncharacterized protein n=1 Tax=Trichinella britovi TaxID=45882 RepID=A0A0V1BJG7_TRIBR|nr:hypothetical protein T03_17404 [Trichinella britovi]
MNYISREEETEVLQRRMILEEEAFEESELD